MLAASARKPQPESALRERAPLLKRWEAREGGGRYQTRTDDLFRVKEARYQLRQSPVTRGVIRGPRTDVTGCRGPGTNRRRDTRGVRSVLRSAWSALKSIKCLRESETTTTGNADVAQLVAHNLAKVGVASSSLVIRSSAGIAFHSDRGTWGQTTRLIHTVAWPSG